MIARYPGAKLEQEKSAEYERIAIPVGIAGPDGNALEVMELTGDVYQYTYQTSGISTLKVYQNYFEAIKKLGFSEVYSCELNACGSKSAAQDLGDLIAITNVNNFYRKPYYVVSTRETPQGRVTIALYFGGYDGEVLVQQVIVEEKGTQTDLVKVDADRLYQEIQQSGKALVYGIYFDIDSAKVKSESGQALQAISDLLESHPDLNLYVVGHTDDTGEGSHNLSLSSRRAASAVEVLKTDYSVVSSRLKPVGVGPYAPVADNESDEGMRLNRRVELVRRL
jgi:outer membrane protein OmpA-like peptidoglycan-associated protein